MEKDMKDNQDTQNNFLTWIDIETTGLDPNRDGIMEIGVVITSDDARLHVRNESSWVVRPSRDVPIGNIHPEVARMHSESGLWAESLSSRLSLTFIEPEIAQFIIDHTEDAPSPACGSTVWFDRSFLRVQAPSIDKAFSHRNLDVSSIKELVRRIAPDVYERLPQGEKKHRVLDDIYFSIAELRYYIEALKIRPL
jgi:oligoribonuclease